MAGSAIVRSLIKSGYTNLLCVDRNELDLRNGISVENWFTKNKPDVVILAAAKVGGILANSKYPVDFLFDNIKIQNNVIESSWRNNVKRFLFLGSSCIYPKSSQQPIKEEYLLTGSLEKSNEWYAIAKITGLKQCAALRKQYGFDAISLMPTNLYGEGDNYHEINSHVLAAMIKRFYDAKENKLKSVTCWGTGKPLREFMHVDDLGTACIFTLENWEPKENEINHLNVGTGIDISIKDLAQKIAKITGFKGEIFWDKSKPDGTPRKKLDISKLKNMGWKPSINLEEGIKRTIYEFNSMKQNGKKYRSS